MEISLENSFGKVYLIISPEKENGWIYNDWIGSLTLDNVIEGATRVLKVMEETGLDLLLNDNTHVTGSWKTANDWLEKEWTPQAISTGLRRCAHVVSQSIFAASSAEEMHKKVGHLYEIRLFSDIEKAKQWLKEAAVQ